MNHIVSLSGGTSSAVAANRVIERYDKNKIALWFADTLWEDQDLYRFLDDLESYWGIPIHRSIQGKTPLEVFTDAKIIPNSRFAPCSRMLKLRPFRKFLRKHPKPVTVHLGIDWTESHRMERPKATYEEMEGVSVDFPLMWEPYANPPHRVETESWGIKTPRMYDMGYPHNNCGGRCIRQGIKTWERTHTYFNDRYNEVADWEEKQIERFPQLQGRGIARNHENYNDNSQPYRTLKEYEKKFLDGKQAVMPMFESNDDTFACICDY